MLLPTLAAATFSRVPNQMSVTRRARDIRVAEQPPDYGQALAERERPAREGMAEVMDAHIFQPAAPPRVAPVGGELRQMPVRCNPGEHPGAARDADDPREHRRRGGRQRYHPCARLGVP